MKALIIGGAGFVGKYLTRRLLEDKYEVVVTKMENEAIDAEGFEVADLDILDYLSVKALLESGTFSCIFHLAAQSSVALSWKNPQLTVDVNIKGALNVLDAMRETEYKGKAVLIGSGEEYGTIDVGEVPIAEKTVLRPGNIYAATKGCQNMLGTIYAKAYGLDIVLVRAFNHIGPGQSEVFVVSDFCKQIVEIEKGLREPILRVGNLEAKRDFTDVRDVVRAYEYLGRMGKAGETYNVGSGKAISIREILDAIIRLSGADVEVVVDENKLRPVDVPVIEADIGKISSMTGWKPEYDLETTITDTIKYWRKLYE